MTANWEKCVDFHGHSCGGLCIGYKVSLYARELLDIEYSADEEIVCIAENDACGIDAIQVMLGCSAGKGNLLFHLRGKQAFNFYNRKNGKAVRLVLKPKPRIMTREESFEYYMNSAPAALFEVKEAVLPLPESAAIFNSYFCDCCGELTAEKWIRLSGDKKLCLDCYSAFDRFNI